MAKYPFRDGIFMNKNLFVFGKDGFFKVVEPRECICNDIVFTRNEMDVRVELFNLIEPANDIVRSGIVSGNVKVVSVDVYHCSKEHGAKFGQDHENGEEFFVTNSVFQLGVIKFVQPEGHWFVILDNVGSHLIVGGISVNVKRFIVIWVGE